MTGRTQSIDDFLDHATRPLRVDRELQIEVRQELQSHVDASVAELRGAGRSEDDARAEALRALGDADALSDQLFKANRRRIRLRAAAAWVVRLVMPAATVALILFLAASTFLTFSLNSAWANRWGVYQRMRDRLVGELPPDARTLLEQGRTSWEQQAPVAMTLVERHPADAAYYVNYASAAMHAKIFSYARAVDVSDPPQVDEAKLAETLAVLAEGERREPGNAYYPLHAAQLLFQASAVEEQAEDVRATGAGPDEGTLGRESRWSLLKIYHPQRFAQAMESVRRGAGKPYFRTYGQELLTRKVGAFPPPRTLADLSLQATERGYSLHDYPRGALFVAGYQASELAAGGDVAQARALIKDVRRANALMLADTWREIDVRGGLAADRLADRAEARVAEAAGDRAAAEAARARWQAGARRDDELTRQLYERRNLRAAGIVYAGNAASTADLTPVRRAYAASTQQFGIALVALAALGLAAVYAASTVPAWVLSTRDAKPPRLFIGWRRLIRVILLGVVLPLALYLAVRWLGPRFGDERGLDAEFERLLLQHLLLGLVIGIVTHALNRRAVKARAAELGVALPRWEPAQTRARLLVGVLAAAMLVVLAVAISPAAGLVDMRSPDVQAYAQVALVGGFWIAMLAVAGWLARGAIRRGWPKDVPLAGALPRSAFPVAVVAALTLAVAGLPLRWTESRALRGASAGSLYLREELAESPYRPLADEILAREGIARP